MLVLRKFFDIFFHLFINFGKFSGLIDLNDSRKRQIWVKCVALLNIFIACFAFGYVTRLLIIYSVKDVLIILPFLQLLITNFIVLTSYVITLVKWKSIVKTEKLFDHFTESVQNISSNYSFMQKLVFKFSIDSILLLYVCFYYLSFCYFNNFEPTAVLICIMIMIYTAFCTFLVSSFYVSCEFFDYSYKILNNELRNVSNILKYKCECKVKWSNYTSSEILDKLDVLIQLESEISEFARKFLKLLGIPTALNYLSIIITTIYSVS